MILFIDNYDSFTYNLVQYIGTRTRELKIVRPDETSLEQIEEMHPDRIVISPGPGHPRDATLSIAVIRKFHQTIPILGVCLGHQCIAEAFGGVVKSAEHLVHGKISDVYHRSKGILRGLPNPFPATRYHSLIVAEESLPAELEVVAYTSDGELMGLLHKSAPLYGLQFHPESILTSDGMQIINNFLEVKVW